MRFSNSTFLDQLAHIVGVNYLITRENETDVAKLESYEKDWRGRERGNALAVVMPENSKQVSEIVHCCSQNNVSIVPQGGNTGLVMGSTPDQSGTQLVLSLKRLNRILAIDTLNLTISVEAGCLLATVQQAAQNAKLFFPLRLASEGSATIGGNLASNAGGTQVLRYGNARQLCLGIEYVNAQGGICNLLHGLRKDNTGFNLTQLLIGSEGILGVITAATLQLFPSPQKQRTLWISLHDATQALALLNQARRYFGDFLTGFELMNHHAFKLVEKHFPEQTSSLAHQIVQQADAEFFVLMELSATATWMLDDSIVESFLQELFTQSTIIDAIIAQSNEQSQRFWTVRESIPLAQAQEGLNIKHDISLTSSLIPKFLSDMRALIDAVIPSVDYVVFGHMGDGNLHYNIQSTYQTQAQQFLLRYEQQVHTLVYTKVHALLGSISAEHGIGRLKREWLAQTKAPEAITAMRAIKRALDPQNILNPHCVFLNN